MKNKKNLIWIIFTLTAIYSAGILVSIKHFDFSNFLLFWTVGILLLKPLYRSGAYSTEASILIFLWLIAGGDTGDHNIYIYFSLVATLLMFAAYRIKGKTIHILVMVIPVLWLYGATGFNLRQSTSWEFFIFISTVLALFIYGFDNLQKYPEIKGPIDLILNSHSGNTGHYTNEFIQSAERMGTKIRLHRFHYFHEFNPELNGSSLVLAFPVSGWKPPWPLCVYLIKKLPRGKGRPAYILYSCAGGPENASIAAWLILTLKGYRVCGRDWAIYSMNVATFRIGPKKMIDYIDNLFPVKEYIEEIRENATSFVSGDKTGMPFVLWPFFLVPAGILLDNKYINIFIYRNYAWRRRCSKCGLCIRACPSGRLVLNKNGYPTPKGTCALCLLCINICPTNAMQMVLFSEYGRPYKPRWPEYVVTERE